MVRNAEESLGDIRNALLVVAALIASATYQAVLQPPSFKIKIHRTPTPFYLSWLSSTDALYIFFISGNTFGFIVSVQMIISLTRDLPFRLPLLLSVFAMVSTYVSYAAYQPFTLLDKEYDPKNVLLLSVLPIAMSSLLIYVQWWLARVLDIFVGLLFRCKLTGDMYIMRPQPIIVGDDISRCSTSS